MILQHGSALVDLRYPSPRPAIYHGSRVWLEHHGTPLSHGATHIFGESISFIDNVIAVVLVILLSTRGTAVTLTHLA